MANVHALGTLTAAGNPANTETVVIGGKTYTFQTTLTDVDGNVKIGASAAASIDNLYAAINLGSGAGTTYATAMTVNPHVVGTSETDTTLVVKSKVIGAIGNLIATTETSTVLSWGAATLASGDGDLGVEIRAILSGEQMNSAVKQRFIDLSDPEVNE